MENTIDAAYILDQVQMTKDMLDGFRITDAVSYANARELIACATLMETEARRDDRNGSHRELLAALGSLLAEVRRMTREYEDLDPHKFVNMMLDRIGRPVLAIVLAMSFTLGACHEHAKPAPVEAVHMWTAQEADTYFRTHCPHMKCDTQTADERSFAEVAGVAK